MRAHPCYTCEHDSHGCAHTHTCAHIRTSTTHMYLPPAHMHAYTYTHTHTHTYSVFSGLVSAILGTPADVVKTRIMNQLYNDGHGVHYTSSWDCLTKTVRGPSHPMSYLSPSQTSHLPSPLPTSSAGCVCAVIMSAY